MTSRLGIRVRLIAGLAVVWIGPVGLRAQLPPPTPPKVHAIGLKAFAKLVVAEADKFQILSKLEFLDERTEQRSGTSACVADRKSVV